MAARTKLNMHTSLKTSLLGIGWAFVWHTAFRYNGVHKGLTTEKR